MPDTAYALDPSGFSNQNNVCTGYLRVIRDLFGRGSDPNVIQSSLMSYMWTLVYPLEYAPQVLGLNAAMAGLAAFGFSAVAVVLRPVIGWMLDCGRRKHRSSFTYAKRRDS